MTETPRDDSSRELARFGFLAGPRVGEELPIPSPVVSIGKGRQNDLVIPDDSVSTTHARLEYEHGGWRITDLDSANGTAVEGVQLAPQVPTPLPFGASVRFGGVRMQFRETEAAVDADAARAGYVPPTRPTPVAQRSTGFRLPVWVLLVVVLLLLLVAWLLYRWTITPAPADPVPQTVSLLLTIPRDVP
jgi:hypothetical protein